MRLLASTSESTRRAVRRTGCERSPDSGDVNRSSRFGYRGPGSAHLLEAAATFVGAAVGAGVFIALHTPEWNTDVAEYQRITRGIEPTYGPFGVRLLTPVLARVVPIEWIATFGLAVAATFLVAFLRPIVGAWRWFGLLLFAVGSGTIALTEPRRVDGLTLAFVAVGFFLMARRSWISLAVLMACAVVNHDLVLLLLPPTLVVGWWRERDVGTWVPVVAGVAAYLALHHTSLVWGHPIGSGVRFETGFFREMAWQPVAIRSSGSVPLAIVRELLTGLGGALLLAPLGWRLLPRWLRDCAVIIPAGLALWFIASDWYRTVSPAYPLVIAAACLGARRLVASVRTRTRPSVDAEPNEPSVAV